MCGIKAQFHGKDKMDKAVLYETYKDYNYSNL